MKSLFSRRAALFGMVALLLLTAALAAYRLNTDPIWYDEFWSIFDAGGAHYGPLSVNLIWQHIATYDPWQPPLYYTLLAGWGALVGWSALAARALSLLFGLLTIAWTYRLGRMMGTRLTGICAALVLGASAFFITYLHEMRNYTLFALLTIIAVSAYWQLIAHRPSRSVQWTFGLSVVALMYTHVFAILIVIAIALYHLLFVAKTRAWWRVVGILAATGLVFLPWSLILLSPILQTVATGGRTPPTLNTREILQMMFYAFGNGVPVLSLVLAGSVPSLRRQVGSRWMWFVVLVAFALALLVNAVVPTITHLRYVLNLFPLLAVIAGIGLARVARFKVVVGGFLTVWIIAGTINAINPAFSDTLFRPIFLQWFRPHLPIQVMGKIVREQAVDGDRIAFHAPYYPWAVYGAFDYYLHGTPAVYTIIDTLGSVDDDALYLQGAREFIGGAGRVWLAVEQNVKPTPRLGEFQQLLADEGYIQCAQFMNAPDLRLDLYVRASVLCTPPGQVRTPIIALDNGIGMTGLEPLPAEVRGTLTVTTTWATPADVPPNVYSVGLYVFNSSGQFVMQTDFALPNGAFGYKSADLNLSALPPGTYTLQLAVYNWQTGERLAGTDPSAAKGTLFPLGKFTVR